MQLGKEIFVMMLSEVYITVFSGLSSIGTLRIINNRAGVG